MPRGSYDTTIQEEIRARGGGRHSSRDSGTSDRDEAVRRMNVRRAGGSQRGQSTAYTPEESGRGGKTSGGGKADQSHRGPVNKPKKKGDPNYPHPTPRPNDLPEVKTPGWPFGIPGYTPPGAVDPGVSPAEPPGGGGGGGPSGPGGPPVLPGGDEVPVQSPLSPELIPLLAAAGLTPEAVRRMRQPYPDRAQIERQIQMTPGVGGLPATRDVIDAEVLPEERRLPAPSRQTTAPEVRQLPAPQAAPSAPDQRRIPAPANQQALPPPSAENRPRPTLRIEQGAPAIDIPLGDVKEKEKVKVKKPKIKKPKLRIH